MATQIQWSTPDNLDATVTNGGGVPVNNYGENTLMPEYNHADGPGSYLFFVGPYLPNDGKRPFEPLDAMLGYNVQGVLDQFGVKLPPDAGKPTNPLEPPGMSMYLIPSDSVSSRIRMFVTSSLTIRSTARR